MNMKELRTKVRMTQFDVCMATRMQQCVVSKIERGDMWVKKADRIAIAEALSCNVDDITFSQNMKDRREN